jgi:sugar phosphate isomerase/epimerase
MKITNHLFPRLGAFFFEHGLSTRHEQIAQFREMGLTSVQIADPLMKELVENPSQASAVAKDFREAGLDIVGLAGYRNLIAVDPVKRRENIDFLKACMDLAPVLGTAVVATETGTFHPSSDWDPSPQNSSPQAWAALLESLDELLQKAKATGTVLALEGYVNNIVGRLDQIDALFRTFPTPHLALMLDPYNYISRNLLPSADLICDEFLNRYADRFVIAHLKDVAPLGADGTPDENGGRADLVGTPEFCTGVFPQQSYMRFLRDRRPDLPIILEHLPVSHLPDAMRKFRSLVGLPV